MGELDSYLAGVPDVRPGTPSLFGPGAVSRTGANRIVQNRVNNTVTLMETRSRLNEYRDRERARTEGNAAMSQLSGLDPMNDPNYQQKVAGIIAQNPSATLDGAVSNFLQIQGGIFKSAQEKRDEAEALNRDRLLTDETERRQLEFDEKRFRKDIDLRREAQADEEILSLPAPLLERFTGYRDFGLSPVEALGKVKAEAVSAGALNELIEMGFDPNSPDIVGIRENGKLITKKDGSPVNPGIYDDKTGLVDPAKVSALKGRITREKFDREEKERLRNENQQELKNLESSIKSMEESLDADPETLTHLKASANRLRTSLGLIPQGESGNVGDPGKPGAFKDDSTTVPTKRPDLSENDRFFKK